MSNESIQLTAEYEEYNAKIENAKSEEEAEAIMDEYFSANVDGISGDYELSEEQMEEVTGGNVRRWTIRPGVPVFDKPGGKIVRVLNEGDFVDGATAVSYKYKQEWFRLTDGTVVNAMHLTKGGLWSW